MTLRGLAIRVAIWACAVGILTLLVRHERGIEFDARTASVNACSVDSLVAYPAADGIVDLDAGARRVAQLSLFATAATVAISSQPFEAVVGSRKNVWRDGRLVAVVYRLASRNRALGPATYSARVFPASRTVRVTLVGHGQRPFRGGSIAAVTNGFALVADDGRAFTRGLAEIAPLEPWVRLRNGRCTLLVWGRGLRAATAVRRPDFPSFSDVSFETSPAARNALALNFTFVYGDVQRELALVRRRLSSAG
jgi:hypothetical protein